MSRWWAALLPVLLSLSCGGGISESRYRNAVKKAKGLERDLGRERARVVDLEREVAAARKTLARNAAEIDRMQREFARKYERLKARLHTRPRAPATPPPRIRLPTVGWTLPSVLPAVKKAAARAGVSFLRSLAFERRNDGAIVLLVGWRARGTEVHALYIPAQAGRPGPPILARLARFRAPPAKVSAGRNPLLDRGSLLGFTIQATVTGGREQTTHIVLRRTGGKLAPACRFPGASRTHPRATCRDHGRTTVVLWRARGIGWRLYRKSTSVRYKSARRGGHCKVISVVRRLPTYELITIPPIGRCKRVPISRPPGPPPNRSVT